MNKNEALELIQETLEVEDELNEESSLEYIDEFDSLGVLNLMVMYENIGVLTSIDDIVNSKTVLDLIDLLIKNNE
jgi:acyl carrier protein